MSRLFVPQSKARMKPFWHFSMRLAGRWSPRSQQNILLRDSIFLLRDSVALWMRGLGADRAKVDSVLERDAAVPLMAGEQKAA